MKDQLESLHDAISQNEVLHAKNQALLAHKKVIFTCC